MIKCLIVKGLASESTYMGMCQHHLLKGGIEELHILDCASSEYIWYSVESGDYVLRGRRVVTIESGIGSRRNQLLRYSGGKVGDWYIFIDPDERYMGMCIKDYIGSIEGAYDYSIMPIRSIYRVGGIYKEEWNGVIRIVRAGVGAEWSGGIHESLHSSIRHLNGIVAIGGIREHIWLEHIGYDVGDVGLGIKASRNLLGLLTSAGEMPYRVWRHYLVETLQFGLNNGISEEFINNLYNKSKGIADADIKAII